MISPVPRSYEEVALKSYAAEMDCRGLTKEISLHAGKKPPMKCK